MTVGGKFSNKNLATRDSGYQLRLQVVLGLSENIFIDLIIGTLARNSNGPAYMHFVSTICFLRCSQLSRNSRRRPINV